MRNLHIPYWLNQFTFWPEVYKDSLFSTSSSTFVISCFFDDRHSKRCEAIPHCVLNLHFKRWCFDVQHLFIHLFCRLDVFLEKCVFSPSVYLLMKLFFVIELCDFLYILDINFLFTKWFANIFFLFSALPFHFVDYFSGCAEACKFNVVPLVDFCFCCLSFWCYIQKPLLKWMSIIFFPMLTFRNFMVSGLIFKTDSFWGNGFLSSVR